MDGETKETWRQLCTKASTEQDPTKLLELVREINRLLEAKQARLNKKWGRVGGRTKNAPATK